MKAIARFFNLEGKEILSKDVTNTVVELFGSVEYLRDMENTDEEKYDSMVEIVLGDELASELSRELEYENDYIDLYFIDFM